MTFNLHHFPGGLSVLAAESGLRVQSGDTTVEIGRRETWPMEAIAAPGGWKTAIELEQLLELGLAVPDARAVVIPYANFDAIEEGEIAITSMWTPGSPFL